LRGHRLIGDADRLTGSRVAFVDPAVFRFRESLFLWQFMQSEAARVVDVEERMSRIVGGENRSRREDGASRVSPAE
jgi:hypothetical protein